MKKYVLGAVLTLTLLASGQFTDCAFSQNASSDPTNNKALTSNHEVYGWWFSKEQAKDKRPEQAKNTLSKQSGHGQDNKNTDHPNGLKPEQNNSSSSNTHKASGKPASNLPPANMPGGHSFASNRDPVKKLYLQIVGGSMPDETPEVIYRFTARTLERHGGVALGSSFHKAELVRENDHWRADISAPCFGTVEVYSRFIIDGRPFYSQYNYLHFLPVECSTSIKLPPIAEIPLDWPIFVFPVSSYNDMPFRGARTGEAIEFEIQSSKTAVKAKAAIMDKDPSRIFHLDQNSNLKISYTPKDDEQLQNPGSTKDIVLLAEIQDSGERLSFNFTVSRSRWGSRKLSMGLAALAGFGLVVAVVVIKRRRSFKYNDFN